MFYCKNCNYSLEITKNVNRELDVTQIKNISTPEELIELVIYNKKYDQDVQLNITFNEQVLKDYITKQSKLYDEQIDAILDKFQQVLRHQKNISHFYFTCNNCSTSYVLQPGTTIYSINFDKSSSNVIDEDITVKAHDPTLPRTKDYICQNKSCASHKDLENKEAVFYRNGKDFQLKYICTMCYTNWNV